MPKITLPVWRPGEVAKSSLQVALCLTMVKIAGVVKVLAMARAFGAGDALDAFLVALLPPSFVADTIAGPLSLALVPSLVKTREGHGPAAMRRLVAVVAGAAIIWLSLAALLLLAGAPFLLDLLAAGFGPEKRRLTQELLAWLAPLIPLSGISVTWRAALNAEESFSVPALAPGCTPVLATVILLTAGPAVPIHSLAVAHLGGICLELGALAVAMRRKGLPLLPRWHRGEHGLDSIHKQHWPLVAITALGNGNVLVDQAIAARLGAGSVSALAYGTRLTAVLAGIAGGALGTVALPRFARLSRGQEWGGVDRTLATYRNLVLLAVLPGALLLCLIAPVLVSILFEGGAFTGTAAMLVIPVQRLSLLQLPALIFSAVLLQLVSALGANDRLVPVFAPALVLHAALAYALSQWLGLPGIVLASGIVHYLTLPALLRIIASRIEPPGVC